MSLMSDKIRAAIRSVPRGKVATYGSVAAAAGYPGASRQVVWTLHRSSGLPWQRIVGAGGAIKLRGEYAIEQRLRLGSEGVTFRGLKVDMEKHQYRFPAAAKPSRKTKSSARPRSRTTRKPGSRARS